MRLGSEDNYFAWQAFNRSYAPDGAGPLPPYLERANYELIRDRASRIDIAQHVATPTSAHPSRAIPRSLCPAGCQGLDDRCGLDRALDGNHPDRATGCPRHLRTAGEHTILPGRVPDSLLERWTYAAAESKAWTERDRSAIYGAFHLYILREPGQ